MTTSTREVVHGLYTEYNRGCRCDECRTAARLYMRDYRERKTGRPYRGRRGLQHGTVSYYTHGCRCDPCRIANTERTREYRARPITTKFLTHGQSGYTGGCRCEICTEGQRVYMREYMRKRRASQAVTGKEHHGGQDQEATG